MPDYRITTETAADTLAAILDSMEPGKTYDLSISERDIGKWSIARLWRAWMSDIAAHMAASGVVMPEYIDSKGLVHGQRPFNAEDAHLMFTNRVLGTDAQGKRLSWSKSGRDGMRPASKGERLLAMQRVEAWATENGIRLMNPRDSEYRKLVDETER